MFKNESRISIISTDIDVPDTPPVFSRYNGYPALLDEAADNNYVFPVKVKCYYELQ